MLPATGVPAAFLVLLNLQFWLQKELTTNYKSMLSIFFLGNTRAKRKERHTFISILKI